MRPSPISPDVLPGRLAELVANQSRRSRLVVDGPPWSGLAWLADAVAEELRAGGRPVLRTSTRSWLRAASIRLETGRTDPDAFYERWLDVDALRRELLDPLGPDGDGRYRLAYRDAATDRASRADFDDAPDDAVLILDGPLLLGQGLPVDLAVHVRMSAGARSRAVPEDERWTLPAYDRYDVEVHPAELADAVVHADHADRPALSLVSRP